MNDHNIFLKYVIIAFFGAAIVALGAHDLQQYYAKNWKEDHKEREKAEVETLIRGLQGDPAGVRAMFGTPKSSKRLDEDRETVKEMTDPERASAPNPGAKIIEKIKSFFKFNNAKPKD